jgi:carboxyl-terminal processing protease
MRNARFRPSLTSHLLVFLLGAIVATATFAHAVPGAESRAELRRYQTLDSFAQALSHISKGHVDVVDERKLIYGAIVGMVGELDPHSAFYTPGQYTRLRQDTEGEFGGVGIALGEAEAGILYPIIESIVPGSPAERAGLLPKDGVVEVNNSATVVDGVSRAAAHAWHSRLRGTTGTRVAITVIRDGWKEPRKFKLVRERVAIPSVTSTRYGSVAHIVIRRFREATTRDLRAALEKAMAVPNTRVLLDLRGNPGGLLDKGISVADTFLDKGVIVSVVSRGGRNTEVARAHVAQSFTDFPMAVLVDQNSASASEIVAAALREHKRAKLIGVPTYGKGSVQTFLDLEDGSGLKLTTSRYLTPSGKTLEGQGLEPDVHVEAFEALVVSPSAKDAKSAPVRKIKGLNKTQSDAMASDPQLLAGYQHLRAK